MHYDFTCTTAQSLHTGLDYIIHQRPAHDSHLPIERVLSNAEASHNFRPAHDSHLHIEKDLSNAEASQNLDLIEDCMHAKQSPQK